MLSNYDRFYITGLRHGMEGRLIEKLIGKKGTVHDFLGRGEPLEVQLDDDEVGSYRYFHQDELAKLPRKGDRVIITEEKGVPHKGQTGVIDMTFDNNANPDEWYYYVKFPSEERRGVLYNLKEIQIVNQSYSHIRDFAEKFVQFCVFNGIRWDDLVPTREGVTKKIEEFVEFLRYNPIDTLTFEGLRVTKVPQQPQATFRVSIDLGVIT